MSAASDLLPRLAALAARRAGPVSRLRRELEGLHRGFTGARGGRAPDYLDRAPVRRAYLASHELPNAARAFHVLDRAEAGLAAGERALDAGAGLGASALALAALSDADSEIVLADRSEPALEEAAALFRELFPDGPLVSTVVLEIGKGRADPPRGPFRTVVAGHLLNELLPRRGRSPGKALEVAATLGGRVAPGGTLVLIEPAQRIPSLMLGKVREALVADGWRPLGPCTHAGPCPVLEKGAKDWCVTDVAWRRPRVVAEADRVLGTDRRRLAVSWLALARDAEPPAGRVFEVLSHPMKAEKGLVLYLCGEGGRLALRVPRRPRAPLPRGSRLLLPAGAEPRGRDRSGAPAVEVHPDDLLRL